ncbi:hypothetical protein [Actinopolymorpha pittospori]|uniref:Uncharacterized protein n=1 Tax=Actinopolymorpha pittospori TaxID=648752 RepID=A0A927N0I1_9ACTN|nr:hypothetical protein [Actinopolymorpha pittospori]MBE1610016.1 hypothetical protein [Actinopolymorpha pittospori]
MSDEALRTDAGETMVLRDNYFVEQALPEAVLRTLTDQEMAAYRRPFTDPGEGRRPTLTWPREIPIDGEPADVATIAAAYADWLATSSVPKLFLKAEPGAILASDWLVDFVRAWPAQTEVTVSGSTSSRKTRRTRSGGPSPTAWRRWADEAMHAHTGMTSYHRRQSGMLVHSRKSIVCDGSCYVRPE